MRFNALCVKEISPFLFFVVPKNLRHLYFQGRDNIGLKSAQHANVNPFYCVDRLYRFLVILQCVAEEFFMRIIKKIFKIFFILNSAMNRITEYPIICFYKNGTKASIAFIPFYNILIRYSFYTKPLISRIFIINRSSFAPRKKSPAKIRLTKEIFSSSLMERCSIPS